MCKNSARNRGDATGIRRRGTRSEASRPDAPPRGAALSGSLPLDRFDATRFSLAADRSSSSRAALSSPIVVAPPTTVSPVDLPPAVNACVSRNARTPRVRSRSSRSAARASARLARVGPSSSVFEARKRSLRTPAFARSSVDGVARVEATPPLTPLTLAFSPKAFVRFVRGLCGPSPAG